MSVTQTLMGPGSFSVSLVEPLPASLTQGTTGLQPWDHIGIGPQGLTDLGLDAAGIQSALTYVGVILTLPDRLTIEGQDLSWWLGDTNGIGPLVDTAIVRSSSTTTSVWMDQVLPPGGINGITKGTVTNGTSFTGVTSPLSTRLELLQFVCERSAVEWYIGPTGAVTVGPSTTLFPAPTVADATIITRNPSGDEGGLSGVEAVNMERYRDGTSTVSRSVVFHTGAGNDLSFVTSSQTPTGVRWKDYAGATPTARSIRGDGEALRLAAAQRVADDLVTSLSVDQKAVRLDSRTHNVTAEVRPGDRVWVYDLETGLTDSANQVTWRGEPITPIQMRVATLTWPITQGMGVYLRIDGTWTDITRYVQVEEPIVSWDVTISGSLRNRSPIRRGVIEIDMPDDMGGKSVSLNRSAGRQETSARVGGWTPTLTNFTVGTGGSAALLGDYSVADGEMRIDVRAVLGTSGASVGTGVTLTMPTGWALRKEAISSITPYGLARFSVAGSERDYGYVEPNGASTTTLRIRTSARASIAATVPATWAAGDSLEFSVVVPVEPV
jgi:hypothetical protein